MQYNCRQRRDVSATSRPIDCTRIHRRHALLLLMPNSCQSLHPPASYSHWNFRRRAAAVPRGVRRERTYGARNAKRERWIAGKRRIFGGGDRASSRARPGIAFRRRVDLETRWAAASRRRQLELNARSRDTDEESVETGRHRFQVGVRWIVKRYAKFSIFEWACFAVVNSEDSVNKRDAP